MEYLQHLRMRSLWVVVVVVMLAVENGCNGCLEKERIGLLQLKDSINFPNGTSLPSWDQEDDGIDCCHWEGVECNSTTRQVIKLELAGKRYTDGEWHLNASILLPFESLRSLDLSKNGLGSIVGNEEFNGLNNLKELYLRGNAIFSISALNGIEILSNLTNLEKLDLSENNLGNGILPSLNKLSNLKFLLLAWNNFNGSIYVKEFDGLNNLKELNLSYNEIVSINALNGMELKLFKCLHNEI
ncbi:hypothetical protein RHSIM_Rhsim01G0101800 [Rhododendron simsii]|uniref:Leucine-rich repeat-containing N-terminal plant-type domain-containing protein n=1 Tax=Rhododendron simsii TaxID=118357 RepID=A0A834LZ85_RHOSS|nr:hypothetical protein RHSIM_Rhsim01G0101800 [Rhododendron simsii]